MPRPPRQLQPGYSYHVTTRCNNREFRLTRIECPGSTRYRQARTGMGSWKSSVWEIFTETENP